jgi:hypothetical protein
VGNLRWERSLAESAADWAITQIIHVRAWPTSGAIFRAWPTALATGPPHGRATLRLAICGTGARTIEVNLAGRLTGLLDRLLGECARGNL